MQRRFTRFLALLCCVLSTFADANAQDVLMAKGNTQITLSTSFVNLHQRAMKIDMEEWKRDLDDLTRFDYSLNFSKPLSITAEYAVSTFTTVGVNVNYFSYDLSELREDAIGSTTVGTKGSHLDLHLRGVRYFFATPGASMYVIGEIGLSKRSIQYSGDSEALAYINTFPETRKDGYETLSYDYGIGFRARLFRTVGASAEFTRLSVFGCFGLYYIIQPAGRRSKDKIGW